MVKVPAFVESEDSSSQIQKKKPATGFHFEPVYLSSFEPTF
jgi:hypothetical protein